MRWIATEQNARRIGIELTPSHVHAVHMLVGLRTMKILGSARVPLPEGAIRGDATTDVAALVLAIRSVLRQAQVTTPCRASIALPDSWCSMVSLSVPPVPDAELPTVVLGELEHYGAVTSLDQTSAFIRTRPLNKSASTQPIGVAAFIASRATIASVVEAMSMAGVTVVSTEPLPIARLRGAAVVTPANPRLYLTVGHSYTDFSTVVGGELRFYRRIDLGLHHLLGDEGAPGPSKRRTTDIHVETVAVELSRSISFFEREDPSLAGHIGCTLVTETEVAPWLAEELHGRTGIPIEIPALPHVGDGGLGAPVGAGAYGLALIEDPAAHAVPPVSFVTGEAERGNAKSQKATLAPFALAAGLLLVGAIAWVTMGQKETVRRGEAARLAKSAEALRAQVSEEQSARLEYRDLRRKGLSFIELMDSLAGSLPSSVGLETVTAEEAGGVRVSGQARDEAALSQAMGAVQRSPWLMDIQIGTVEERRAGEPLQFTLTAKLRPRGAGNR